MSEQKSTGAQADGTRRDQETGPTGESGQESELGPDAAVEQADETGNGPAGAHDSATEDETEQLRARLEEVEARASEYWEKLLRAEAEKDNIRKRAEREAASARRQALEKFAGELLAVRDSLELGQNAANREDASVEKIREGTELTLQMLVQAMEKFDIEEINPLGEKFDPELHQAMSMQEAEGYASNTVTQVVQKGYRMEDRLLRPALVMVAK